MTFTEWYKETEESDWHEDYAHMYGYAMRMADEHEVYYKDKNISLIWNG